jgi:hypothetical protein
MKKCHKCGSPWISDKKQPAAKEYCESCSAWLHCCLNCRYHDAGAHNQCYIPNTEWIGDRRGPNFCDEFEFREGGSGGKVRDDVPGARKAFDALFADVESGTAEEKPRSIDDLFPS